MARVIARIVAWDLDGTLVRAGDLGAAVFDDALEEVLGRRPAGRVRMGGKTDAQIVGEYLDVLGVADTETTVVAVLAALGRHLVGARAELAATGRACAGAAAVLAALAVDERVVSTALTGNIAVNAAVKLEAFGLDQWLDLDVGGYGSDERDRRRLVPVVRRRVRERYGVDVPADAMWVVGDTPRDLECARAGGARCLLVATGRSSAAELHALGPDALVEDLVDTERIVGILSGGGE